ncbi:MAG: RNA 2',3'-cyclic phosphodiesterase [Bacteroidales bacterium]
MKRTFVAVKTEPGEKLIKIISLLRAEFIHDSVKWVDPDRMHLTLAFLGDTDEDTIGLISQELEKKCTGSGTVTFTVASLGVFPGIHHPRVIWAGIANGETLVNLYGIVTGLLSSLNIPLEEREVKPHLTLGRIKFIKNTERLKQFISEYENIVFQKVTINELIYYESILQPAGPVYKPITRILL